MTETQRAYITHDQPATQSGGYRAIMHERDVALLTPTGERIQLVDASALTWLADVLNDYDAIVSAACEAADRIEAHLRARKLGYDQDGDLEAALAAINATGIRKPVGLPVAVLTDAQVRKLSRALFGDSATAGVSPSPRPSAIRGGEVA